MTTQLRKEVVDSYNESKGGGQPSQPTGGDFSPSPPVDVGSTGHYPAGGGYFQPPSGAQNGGNDPQGATQRYENERGVQEAKAVARTLSESAAKRVSMNAPSGPRPREATVGYDQGHSAGSRSVVSFGMAQFQGGTGPSLAVQVPSVEAALEMLENLTKFAAVFMGGTQLDDHVLRHIQALRRSPDLIKELQADLELLMGGFQGEGPQFGLQAQFGLFDRLGVVQKILDRLKGMGLNLNFATILKIISLVMTMMGSGGGMSFTDILTAIIELFRSGQLQGNVATAH